MSLGRAIRGGAKWAMRIVLFLLALAILLLAGFRIAAALREGDEGRPAETRMIETPLGGVAVQLSGPEGGQPILLVHGTAGWSGFWRNVSAHLAGRGWRVIAVDLPPFGYSEHDRQARYDRASQATRLAAVLEQAAGRPAVVVGHSFGSGAAVELALRAPGRVKRLVLVDAALGTIDPAPVDRGQTRGLLGQSWIAQPLVSASMTNPMLTGALLRSMLARKEAADAWVETIRQPMRRAGTTAAYAAWLPELFVEQDSSLSRRSANLRRIAMPVDLIWGEADTVTPIAQGRALARLMRARSFTRLIGVGHIPHIEEEALFLEALDIAIGGAR
ncbi:MAG TPA: alpha/beta hydrolase [Allosphingosinicella sp.]|nr:alpha/beta hydrolase [Allosphingosinicella sp.]